MDLIHSPTNVRPSTPTQPLHSLHNSTSRDTRNPSRLALYLLLTASVFLTLWLLLDGSLRFPENRATLLATHFRNPFTTWQTLLLMALEGSFVCGTILYLLSFTRHLAHQLHLRSLFAFTFLVACWLSLHLHWNELVFAGRILRISFASHQIEAFTLNLDANWGQITHLQSSPLHAPFNAYPPHDPAMLMLLHQHPIPNTDLSFMSIERSQDHAIRLELSDSNLGYWIELLPCHHTPSSFTGGLGEQHFLHSQRPIRPQLWLTEYR